jgi:hypothetical protein
VWIRQQSATRQSIIPSAVARHARRTHPRCGSYMPLVLRRNHFVRGTPNERAESPSSCPAFAQSRRYTAGPSRARWFDRRPNSAHTIKRSSGGAGIFQLANVGEQVTAFKIVD